LALDDDFELIAETLEIPRAQFPETSQPSHPLHTHGRDTGSLERARRRDGLSEQVIKDISGG